MNGDGMGFWWVGGIVGLFAGWGLVIKIMQFAREDTPPSRPIITAPPVAQPGSNPNLTPCPDCGRMLSKLAPSCPQCGRPTKPANAL
jgi:hypothetical protein